jgi:hypothetical protein
MWGGAARPNGGAFGSALIFLLLFASRQKVKQNMIFIKFNTRKDFKPFWTRVGLTPMRSNGIDPFVAFSIKRKSKRPYYKEAKLFD